MTGDSTNAGPEIAAVDESVLYGRPSDVAVCAVADCDHERTFEYAYGFRRAVLARW